MACKDILVHFDSSPIGIRRLEAAGRLAERHDAHLTALTFALMPQRYAGMEGPVPVSILRELEARMTEETERNVAELDRALAALPCRTERRVVRCWPDRVADTLAQHARYADLLVLGQPGEDSASYVEGFAVGDLLLSCGRPVLLIPHTGVQAQAVGDKILVAWNGRREAARALADAMPLIEAARSVHVLSVDPDTSRAEDLSLADIAAHLARHDVRVETLTLPSRGGDPVDLTLKWMFEQGIDLLVMGAYGHSRARELVFGGMTRGMLRRMTVPVLMSH